MYSINFTEKNKKFCLSLHYNGASSYLFVNGKEIIKFKAKDSEIVASPLCLGNISKDWSAYNMKKTGLNGQVYEFNVDYRYLNPSGTDKDMPIIHKYLMGKYKIFQFIKKIFFIGLKVLSDFTNTTSSLSCISMKNQECKIRPQVVNTNSNDPIFYPFSIKISKCSGNCNDINDPYAKICVPDIIKNLNVKIFSLM